MTTTPTANDSTRVPDPPRRSSVAQLARWTAVLGVGLLSLTACGDLAVTGSAQGTDVVAGSDAITSATGPTPASGSSVPALQAILVRPDEVPAGYRQSPRYFSDAPFPSYDTACGEVPATSDEANITFEQDLLGPFIYNSVSLHENVDEVFDAYENAAESCARQLADGNTATTMSFEQVPFPTIGDRTYAAVFDGTLAGFAYSGEIVLVARGHVVNVMVMIGSPTVDTTELERLARTVAERMLV